ncbi:MAG: cyclic nucleotide-binding domain-containing protein, partial [Bacteroidota bacterium]
MQKLFQTIEGQQRLSTEDRELIFQLSEEIRCPKGSILIEIGQIPDALYFVLNGFLRLFQYADNGLEITNHLNCPPGFITPYADFVERQASTQALECITDCELIRISKVNFDRLIAESSAMKDFSIWVYQQSLAYNETRARDLASLTAT